jgi:hypothetical protein
MTLRRLTIHFFYPFKIYKGQLIPIFFRLDRSSINSFPLGSLDHPHSPSPLGAWNLQPLLYICLFPASALCWPPVSGYVDCAERYFTDVFQRTPKSKSAVWSSARPLYPTGRIGMTILCRVSTAPWLAILSTMRRMWNSKFYGDI